jgi:hypothetical protein
LWTHTVQIVVDGMYVVLVPVVDVGNPSGIGLVLVIVVDVVEVVVVVVEVVDVGVLVDVVLVDDGSITGGMSGVWVVVDVGTTSGVFVVVVTVDVSLQ